MQFKFAWGCLVHILYNTYSFESNLKLPLPSISKQLLHKSAQIISTLNQFSGWIHPLPAKTNNTFSAMHAVDEMLDAEHCAEKYWHSPSILE